MPHDKNGNRLREGDEVVLRAKVTELYEGEDACNLTIEGLESPAAEGEVLPVLTTNTGFVEKVDEEAEREPALQTSTGEGGSLEDVPGT